MSAPQILVMAKAPVPGRVKTRRWAPGPRDVDTVADARAVAAMCPPDSRFACAVAAGVPSPTVFAG